MQFPAPGMRRNMILCALLTLTACAPFPQASAQNQGAPLPPWKGLAVPAAIVPGSAPGGALTAEVAPPAAQPANPAEGQVVDIPVEVAATADDASLESETPAQGLAAAAQSLEPPPLPAEALVDAPLSGAVTLAIDPSVPAAYGTALRTRLASASSVSDGGNVQNLSVIDDAAQATTLLHLGAGDGQGYQLAERFFVPVLPFDSVQDEITLDELVQRWRGSGTVYTTEEGWAFLPTVLGSAGANVFTVPADELRAQLEANRSAIGILPFDQLDPRYKVLTLDGVNVLSNALEAATWPLVARLVVSGAGASAVASLLQGAVEPFTNRDPGKLTTLVMTGVTAMARGTAAAIERAGDNAYPARVIGPELAQADITHVSNEIPFIEGCVVENFENNLILCSDPAYWEALALMGTDIVGLSGNHVNDFGRDGARESLQWYKDQGIPIYGSGLTVDEACAPLLWEHNGNTFAFIAALAYGPESAWVTDEEPGACYYYEHKDRILAEVMALAAQVDVVAVELQYEETYFPSPTESQVIEFRELRDAGADLVTGVQSHVPQAQEPYGRSDAGGPGMISYGLGNLFFDQMWSWETRTELYLRHTIYDGEIVSSEILTGILEDFAQPRWATPEERTELLQTIFDGAPARAE